MTVGASGNEPLLGSDSGQDRPSKSFGNELLCIAVLFVAKLVASVANQCISVFAPFLATAAGGMTFPDYRLGLVAADVAAVLPAVLPLEGISPRILGPLCMGALAASFCLPQVFLPADGPPMPGTLAAFRFVSGVSWTSFAVLCGAVLSALPVERRMLAMTRVEMAWTVGSLAMPIFGVMLDDYGATVTLMVLIVVPAVLLAAAMARLLPERVSGAQTACAPDEVETDSTAATTSLLWRMAGVICWVVCIFGSQAVLQCRFGGWLRDTYSMSASSLGAFSNAIAVGNLVGNFIVQVVCGRWLSARSLCLATSVGVFLVSIALALLPASSSVGWAFVLVLLYYICGEVGFLSAYNYTAELLHDNQTAGMSYFFGLLAFGRVVGDWLAPYPSMPGVFCCTAAGGVCGAVAIVTVESLQARKPR